MAESAPAQESAKTFVRPRLSVPRMLTIYLDRGKPNTRAQYRAALRQFALFLEQPTVEEAVTRLIESGPLKAGDILLAYRDSMRQQGLSVRTRNLRISVLNGLLKSARSFGFVDWTVDARCVETERPAPSLPKGPDEIAFRRLVGVASTRDRAILRLLHDMALRGRELVSLDVGALNLNDKTITVRGRRGGATQVLPLTKETGKALHMWIGERGAEPGPLFVPQGATLKKRRLGVAAVRAVIRRCRRRAGVGHVTAEGLRSAGIRKRLSGGDIYTLYGVKDFCDIDWAPLLNPQRRTVLVAKDPERGASAAGPEAAGTTEYVAIESPAAGLVANLDLAEFATLRRAFDDARRSYAGDPTPEALTYLQDCRAKLLEVAAKAAIAAAAELPDEVASQVADEGQTDDE